MVMDYLENVLQLAIIIVMQVLCLFQYIKHKKRDHILLIMFFLCFLTSCYYWTTYLLIMGDWPNASDVLTYLGWNVAFFLFLLLLLQVKTREERRYFHPLMLLPIPLNIYQLMLYLPFGGAVNSIYQTAVMTAIAVFSIQGICWYWKNRGRNVGKPFVTISGLLFSCFEFGMWTSSCFGWPSSLLNPYYYCSMLCSLDFLFMGWAVNQTGIAQTELQDDDTGSRQQRHLKVAYLLVVFVCCLGGLALGIWIKDTLIAGTAELSETSVFDIIPVVLFVCSLIIVAFAIAIILLVYFGEKAAQSEALRKARQTAERANAAKSEFLANMSHEIRTPINAMLGMNEIILRESLQARDLLPREREVIRAVFSDICNYAGDIESAGKSLLSIINDILDFSKIEAGKLEIAPALYKLSSALNDVSNMILFKARAKGLDFRVDVDETIPDVLNGDEVRVRQIITNLLNNAVKYTDKGSVRLSVKAQRGELREGDAIDLVICVEDTGIGIREDDLSKLFSKFERVDLARNSTVEGTGLGLAIVRNLLDLMGGSIDVQSTYGKGSAFTVTLPQKVMALEPVGDFREKFEKSIQGTKVRQDAFRAPNAHILIVDDTRMNLTVVTGLLKNTQIEIDAVTSGEEAIKLARSIRYDLILMDQRMPVMDGTEAMHRIQVQENGANRATPMICLTADAVSGARERYLAEGFTDYLTKPIDSAALEKMMIKYLPPEKVILQSAEKAIETVGTQEPDLGGFAYLRNAGIDPQTGLGFCQGDAALYETMLREYLQGVEERQRDLQSSFDAGDWKNYGVHVHALKSTSRMIGATGLSERAAALETASDQNDEKLIRQAHDDMMAEYCALTAFLAAHIDTGDQELNDDDVLEFMPEEE